MLPDPRILLLRGVNVGAHRKLPMADLREILAGLGLVDVRTHIQSGNAVFRDPQGRDGLGPLISQGIGARFAFTPESLVLDRAAFESVLAANPFSGEDPGKVSIGFLACSSAVSVHVLEALAAGDERCALTPAAFYLHSPAGIGRSKLAAQAERRLAVPMTVRNARVAQAIASLAQEL
ncbi:DUF1697 domain-containing protein [Pararhodobacter zhoushanensis]|uniref:DUF1697 domain-containing protein n=1 Tax=Pararhodobacter zhoushanensis TaxID=2479545 RepID=A0ABT3GWM9_9RHOB|nr:DUF1697 domain-containing protein [Pararhodobacter zhoushanensis]MCW1931947.1 DUF1697 domain-containing protein [Pararhodobacter zhoushanensis]